MRNTLDYGQGDDTVLYSLTDEKFYSYENDCDEIHKKYGGGISYKSLTGLTVKGHIPHMRDLIEFGTYTHHSVRGKIIMQEAGYNVYGYMPIRPHEGIDEMKPLVVTIPETNTVMFLSPNDWSPDFLDWKGELKEMETRYYNYENMDEKIFKWNFYNPCGYTGVSALRFLDVDPNFEVRGDLGRITELTNILMANDTLYHWNRKECYLDRCYGGEPWEDEGLLEGTPWYCEGDGLLWKREGLGVHLLGILDREVDFEKYQIEGVPFIEYELEMSLVEFYKKDMPAWKLILQEKMLTKARLDYIANRNIDTESCKKLLEKNPHGQIFIKDFLDAGSCLPGTMKKLKEFGFTNGGREVGRTPLTDDPIVENKIYGEGDEARILVEDVLKNKHYKVAITNTVFQKTVFFALTK